VHVLELHDAQVAEPAHMPQRVHGALLNTASAGGAGKYRFHTNGPQLSYPQVLPVLLAATGGVHHHFGNLAPEQLDVVRGALAQGGIDPTRFVYHGNVASVQRALLDIPNPVYMPSFPVGGALTIVEVMSVGVPVLLNVHAAAPDDDFAASVHRALLPDLHATFMTLDDVAPALAAIGAGYDAYSRASNERFERCHSRASFLAGLRALHVA
jgi:hypothetical protein